MKGQKKFWILTIIVAISGLSQGLLLPLIAIIFEENGVSSSLNGFHATGIYLGVLLISPFIEAPLHKFGYKPIILTGGFLVAISLLTFPLWFNLYFWFFYDFLLVWEIICFIFLHKLGLEWQQSLLNVDVI